MFVQQSPDTLTRRLFLISPVSLSILGMSTFIFAWVFPPNLFEQITGERCYVFLDVPTFLFNMGCLGMLLLGCYFASLLKPVWLFDTNPRKGSAPMSLTASLFLLLSLVLAGVVSLGITSLNVGIGNLVNSVFSGGYRTAVKEQLESETMGLGSLSPLMLPCYALALALSATITHRYLRWISFLFLIAFGAFFLPSVLFARRSFLLRPLFGLGMVVLLFIAYSGRRVTPYILGFFAGFFVLGVTVFGLVAIIRADSTSVEKQVFDFTRYLVTSYNTEAMMMQGKLTWDGGGKGFYWTQFIWNFPGFANLLDLHSIRQQYFGMAAPFGAETRSELLRDYGVSSSTNITAFGSSYVDFGVLGVAPFFITGFLFQHAFYSFLGNRLYGMLMYPYIAWAAVDWRGNLTFPGATFGYLLLIFAGCYVLGTLFPDRNRVLDDDEDEDFEYESDGEYEDDDEVDEFEEDE